MRITTRAHLGLLATNLFFALNLSVIKYFTSHNYAGPYGLNVVRSGVCVVLFWSLFLFQSQKRKIRKGDLIRFTLCGLTALAINQMFFMKGLSMTYSIHASLLLLITPIMITFIAGWILKEKITLLKLGGLLMGVTGAAILIASGKNNGNGNNTLIGDLLVILSTVSYTFYFILVRPLMKKYDSLDVMRWVFTIGFIFIVPLGWNELEKITWPVFGVTDYLLLFLLVVPGTFLAYIFNVYGIKILGASVAGTYIYSQPVFAVITAAIFLNESLDIYRIIAGLLIFCGVYLANKQVAKE